MGEEGLRISPAFLEECRRSESLIEQASEGIFVADLSGRYVYVNSAGAKMLGYSRDEIIGKTIIDLIPPDEVPKLRESKHALDTGAVHVAEWHLRRKDGSYLEVEVSAKIFPDGRWQGFVRDVSDRKRLERALQQAVADLNRAQAVAHVGSWQLDVRRNRLTWSAEAHRIYGLPLGRPLTYEVFLSCVHPDDLDFVDHAWSGALLGEPYHIEHRIIAGGRVKWVVEHAEVQFDATGEAMTGIGTVQDVTDRKQVEDELMRTRDEVRRLSAELEQAIGRRASGRTPPAGPPPR